MKRKRIADFMAEWADVKKVYDFIAEVNSDAHHEAAE